MSGFAKAAGIFVLVAVVGCARHQPYTTGSDVIVDTKGVDMQRYETDLYECRQYAEQVQVAERAATNAGAGAVVGGVLGAVVGDSDTAKRGAGVGAVTGGLHGAGSALEEKRRIVRNCLRGRGYRVLN